MTPALRSLVAPLAVVALLPAMLVPACTASSERAPEAEAVSIVGYDRTGAVAYDEHPTVDEVERAVAGLPGLTVDGVETDDPGAIFGGRRISLPRHGGGTVELVRDGDQLRRVEPGAEVARAVTSVEWSAGFDRVVVHAPQGDLANELAGLGPDATRRFAAYVAIASLDPYAEIAVDRPYALAAGAIVIALAALAVVGYLGCITIGSLMCSRAATEACGAGNVDAYSTVCGAGHDLNGEFRLGYFCSYRCKPAPTPVASATPAASPTATATPEASPTATATPEASPTASPSATPVASPSATPVASPSATPVASPSVTPVASPGSL